MDNLKSLLDDALSINNEDYFRLVALRMTDEEYAKPYIASAVHDMVVFKAVSQQLNSDRFKSRKIWNAWCYVRELVVKYVSGEDPRVRQLNDGLEKAFLNIRLKYPRVLGRVPVAESAGGRGYKRMEGIRK